MAKPKMKIRKLKIRKRNKMSFIEKLAYEFLPTTDKSILSVDKDIAKL